MKARECENSIQHSWKPIGNEQGSNAFGQLAGPIILDGTGADSASIWRSGILLSRTKKTQISLYFPLCFIPTVSLSPDSLSTLQIEVLDGAVLSIGGDGLDSEIRIPPERAAEIEQDFEIRVQAAGGRIVSYSLLHVLPRKHDRLVYLTPKQIPSDV